MSTRKTTTLYGKYEITNICRESADVHYPCRHYVRNTETNNTTLMGGDEIYCLLLNEGFRSIHFDHYKTRIKT